VALAREIENGHIAGNLTGNLSTNVNANLDLYFGIATYTFATLPHRTKREPQIFLKVPILLSPSIPLLKLERRPAPNPSIRHQTSQAAVDLNQPSPL
jgi:hypothetical protein